MPRHARGRDEDVGEVLAHAALEREGFGRGRAGMGRVGVEGHIARAAVSSSACRSAERVGPLCSAVRRRRAIAASASVSGVSRRNRLGGKRSIVPRTTPSVSCVSTSPSTVTVRSVERPVRR